MKNLEPLIFDLSADGRSAVSLPKCEVPEVSVETLIPKDLLRQQEPSLPELSEVDVVRHFTRLSTFNHGVDTGFYPLGSCTMKYNPKVNEMLSRLSGFTALHPYQPESLTQGALQLMAELQEDLCELSGMDGFTLQPAAGAHGEMTGILIIKAYHDHRQDTKRKKVIVPDSAHGTNPATAAMAGYETIQIPSNERGGVDLEALKKVLNDEVAALMLTNPNTVGLFEEDILEITKLVHDAGGLLYYDGANTNAVMGIARPGDMGFDVVHLNLHKTFATPHGGGGPGSGPVGVKDFLIPFLPKPIVVRSEDGTFTLQHDMPLSIGKVRSFYANFSVVVRAYAYIRSLGGEGLRAASESAVLNANYLMSILKEHYFLPFDRICKHEFIITPKNLKSTGVHTLDIAKRLLDYGYHPPTIYFPIIVEEAMMIEPTETESIETLDEFAQVLIKIAEEAQTDADLVKNAPYTTLVTRLDEVGAVRKPNLRWRKEK
ncbi:aminomethyl-transferring glycine dehydrogenase subunit GcvPB [Desulfosporosinus sp.]|uniref:aminomethyl-transferring glycine dehydrogenase subunit GcvPB n=1 Tax=Desulfosporosinus sp. TaxID=157907 RepID=UPI0025BCC9DD|nr:aminomethyl-transferring glycine dehydrogenase subunit GcvPB [Desulfosporosinus sp.]MBC2721688.1 aminomethyl-transferring glycine dehydrogenase subunit GcvPB [Desulfosporosinus sp.]MBC2728125.1 aminomethyl-transferring glycine dehydrogenase subunit GcvPB [Desulfosporosinus sp.]